MYPYLSVGRLFRDPALVTGEVILLISIPTYRWGGYFETIKFPYLQLHPKLYPYLSVGRLFRDWKLLSTQSNRLGMYPYLSVGRLFRDRRCSGNKNSSLKKYPYLSVDTLVYQPTVVLRTTPTVPTLQTINCCRLLNVSHLSVGRLFREIVNLCYNQTKK